MYIVYPEKMQLRIISEEKEEELIGYAKRYMDDELTDFGVIETKDMKRIKNFYDL